MSTTDPKTMWERFAGVPRSELERMVLTLEAEREGLRAMQNIGETAAETRGFLRAQERAAIIALDMDPTSPALRIIAGRIRGMLP